MRYAADPRVRRTPRQRRILRALRGVLSHAPDGANRPRRRLRERQRHAPLVILLGVDYRPRLAPRRACAAARPRSRERRSRPRCRSPGGADPDLADQPEASSKGRWACPGQVPRVAPR
jgi:hypothetical protein